MKFPSGLRSSAFSVVSFPGVLLGLCVVVYGLLLPSLGFYWDDWPWLWASHVSGVDGLLKIDQMHRPLAGAILWFGAQLSGLSPLRWQLLNLVYRWLTGVALWWALERIWPGQMERSAWIVFLFLVYPGFEQQFVSVNSSRHILPLAIFFLSIGFMAWAMSLRALKRKRYWLFSGIALFLALLTMLSTEYYYGLELIRGIILWLQASAEEKKPLRRLSDTFRFWSPYLGLLVVVFVWRYWVSLQVNYPITLTSGLTNSPLDTARYSAQTVLHNFSVAFLSAWSKAIEFPDAATFGARKTLFYGVLVTSATIGAAAYLFRLRDRALSPNLWKQEVGLGLFSLLVAGLPFLATQIKVGPNFPSDRTTLPMMLGASLLFVGLVDGLARNRILKIVIVSLAVGLAAGVHFENAASYQRDWNYQRSFLQQLAWRAPGLEAGTAIFTTELPNNRSTDNSLTAPLNWMYAPDTPSENLPYMIFFLENRLGGQIPALEKGLPISVDYLGFHFAGSTDAAVVIYYQPPACLRLLHPQYDAHFPQLPELIRQALPLADLDAVTVDASASMSLPADLLGSDSEASWCYYFQKADLARQLRDWEQVAALGDVAFGLDDSPNHASERAPFIQGYAHVGRWKRAEDLTFEALEINKFMHPMMCDLWRDLAERTPDSEEKRAALARIRTRLAIDCPLVK